MDKSPITENDNLTSTLEKLENSIDISGFVEMLYVSL